MAITEQQVNLLMKIYEKTRSVEIASAKSCMCRQTGAKYLKGAALADYKNRRWRTRLDPLAKIWNEAETFLKNAPEIEAKALFLSLCEKYPGQIQESHLRTFQRRVRFWRSHHGKKREVFFPQVSKPGKRMSLDFTNAKELGVSIAGEAFPHLLCHCCLSYSNWEWASICSSESLVAIRGGLQDALFHLGRIPKQIWTDNSTAATHRPCSKESKRVFNENYLELVHYFGMEPHTIAVGKSNENGTVESLNGHLKRRLRQHLLLRGSSDFESREEYKSFLCKVLNRANDLRTEKLHHELALMRVLSSPRLPDWSTETVLVHKWSTVNIANNTYSVPSHLIGKRLEARIYDDNVEIFDGCEKQLCCPRLLGRGGIKINYRHIIHSLVRKPGAFRNYRYRSEMFPTLNFRKTYDLLNENHMSRMADVEYLHILELAAKASEEKVDNALASFIAAGQIPRARLVEEAIPEHAPSEPPKINIPAIDLSQYNRLISEVAP